MFLFCFSFFFSQQSPDPRDLLSTSIWFMFWCDLAEERKRDLPCNGVRFLFFRIREKKTLGFLGRQGKSAGFFPSIPNEKWLRDAWRLCFAGRGVRFDAPDMDPDLEGCCFLGPPLVRQPLVGLDWWFGVEPG